MNEREMGEKGLDEARCELCDPVGGALLWEDALCRVVQVADSDYSGFCRVILKRHVAEMTDLASEEQLHLMRVVLAVEAVLRRLYQPDKINLASLGNVTPHLHWHVIPRWRDDRHFPNPIWGEVQRASCVIRPPVETARLGQEIRAALTPALLQETPEKL
jgi:diadenosine tetraphosphate (Ap4A) HIT family hydrolase